MFVSSDHVEFFIISVVPFCEPFEKICDDIGVIVSYKQIINMPADSHLFTVNQLVGNARIVGIYFKTNRSKIGDQLSIK